jgi:hypothetical protein
LVSLLWGTLVLKKPKILFAAALVLALAASPAIADTLVDDLANLLGLAGQGKSNGHGNGRGAPGPIAGAGLGYLVLAGGVAGGYYLYRRRKHNSRG